MCGLFENKEQNNETNQPSSINWDRFNSEFVRLESDVPRKLKMTNWRQGTWFNTPGLRFDVVEVDGNPANRIFSTTSKRLIHMLKPFIMRAEAQGKTTITVSICRSGEGLNTAYDVREDE